MGRDRYPRSRIDVLGDMFRLAGEDLYGAVEAAASRLDEIVKLAKQAVKSEDASQKVASLRTAMDKAAKILSEEGIPTLPVDEAVESFAASFVARDLLAKFGEWAVAGSEVLREMWRISSPGWGNGRDAVTGLAAMSRCGFQRFHLSSVLAEELAQTKFRSPLDYFQLPYQAFAVALPVETSAALPVRHSDGSSYPLREVWVSISKVSSTEETTLVVTAYGDNGGACGTPSFDENMSGFYVRVGSLVRLRQRYVDESAFQEAIDAQSPRTSDPKWAMALLRIVCNTVLYVNSVDVDRQPVESDFARLSREMGRNPKPTQRERREAALGSASQVSVVRLGHRLRRPSGSAGGGHALKHQHWVRGHWRLQRVGIGRSEVRRTWVRPHRRGVGLPPLIRAGYAVDSEPLPTPLDGATPGEGR